jgi:hypothetical protein
MSHTELNGVLSGDEVNLITEVLMSEQFPWYCKRSVAYNDYDDDYYFYHNFINGFEVTSPFLYIIEPIIKWLDAEKIIRAKANLYPSTQELYKHQMHTDADFDHKGALFFVNTNDGITTLDDGTEVESVQNKLMLFDPTKKHCSSTCTNDYARLTINFNYH